MPLPSTMTPIATVTLASNSATFSFTNIPQTYTDLVLVMNYACCSSTGTTANTSPQLRINSDSGGNYSETLIYGFGSTANSGRETTQTAYWIADYGWVSTTANYFGTSVINFMNYANTTTYKTLLERTAHNDSAYSVSMGSIASVGLWRSTSAITSIDIRMNSTNLYRSGSTFTLYGIKAA